MPVETRRTRVRSRYVLAFLAAATLAIGGSLAASSAAYAAGTPTQVDSVTFQNTTFQDQSTQRLDVTWHATESPATNPVVLEFDIPAGLHGAPATFSMATAPV
jgi:hypothetical protein